MSEVIKITSKFITAHDANVRWQQSLELYSTFAEIWVQNPQLAKQAGRRVQELVMPLADVQQLHKNDLK